MSAEEQSEGRTLWSVLGPTVYNVVALVMNLSFAAAGLAAIYILFGMFSGNLAGVDTLPQADQTRVLGVLGTASQILLWGLMIGSLCVALVLWGEETIGYIMLAGAVGLAFGIPFVFATFGNQSQSGRGLVAALMGFRNAAYVPGVVGLALVIWDIIRRFTSAFRDKQMNPESFTYGNDASAERKPMRTSLFGRCWEGPYCRDSIRPHCPIFQAKKACWKERRGCYCEEDIVTQAAQKVQGIVLGMAPDPQRNYANSPTPGAAPTPMTFSGIGGSTAGRGPEMTVGGRGIVGIDQEFSRRRIELTMAEKVERCRNCIIYNEHQAEKYRILLPIVIIGGIALCFFLSGWMKDLISGGFTMADALVSRISFKAGGQNTPTFGKPNDIVSWGIVVAVSLMIVSKMLQTLEWACFKAKI
ncbi:MAG: hypothetical protein SFU56_17940 [Capsulimonadales bacterium]|nr:hypothetical protein [Capsulimonadales bacterium]